MLLDIHSHILPSVDDGSKNIDESIKMLTIMKNQGIDAVVATPHFYANQDNFEEFQERIKNGYSLLKSSVKQMDLPEILLGCEFYYFDRMSISELIHKFTINESKFLLLELSFDKINNSVYKDILALRDKSGIVPIIAHLERYSEAIGYRKLLKFIKTEHILAQINTSSIISKSYKGIVKKLIKGGYVSFLGTDAHNIESRPPTMGEALIYIENNFGTNVKEMFVKNSEMLYSKLKNEAGNVL